MVRTDDRTTTCPGAYLPADWPMFGRDPARSDISPTGFTVAALKYLRRQEVALPGIADSSPILMTGIVVGGRARNLLVVTTSYGISLGIDARTGGILWPYTPPGISGWENTGQITETSPVADPDRRYVYVASPNGLIHKLAIATGREVRAGGWPARVTLQPTLDKVEAALNLSGCLVIATTSGYFDTPPYQGHVVTINRMTGRLAHVFNTLCSNRTALIAAASCTLNNGSANWGSAIFGRGSPVVDPSTGDLLVATGNGDWNGSADWGDSLLELSPDGGRLLQNYTPTTQETLNVDDLDLGSSSPAILPAIKGWHMAVQGGKDRILRLLNVRNLNGHRRAGPYTGGQLGEVVLTDQLFSAPTAIANKGGALVLVGNPSALSAYEVAVIDGHPRIHLAWQRARGASTPIIANDLIYAYDPYDGGLNVYTLAGRLVRNLPAGVGHWSSPIIAGGVIALPEGSANDHVSHGVLDIYR